MCALRATSADPGLRDAREAIRLVEADARASEAPWLLDTLAAAYAADSRFDDAIRTAEREARIATAQGRSSLREIEDRLVWYRQ